MDKKDTVSESPSSVTYNLFKSPAKELHKINSIVANGTTQGTVSRNDIKRTLPFDEPALPVVKVIRVEGPTQRITSIDRRLTSLITERQDNREDESRK